jgi:hypothetical protein
MAHAATCNLWLLFPCFLCLPCPFPHLQHAQEWVQHHLHSDALAEAAAILLQQVEQVAAVGILLHHHHAVALLQAGKTTAATAGTAGTAVRRQMATIYAEVAC